MKNSPDIIHPLIEDAFWKLREQAITQAPRSLEPQRPLWIFGCGQFAQALAHALRMQDIPVAGFIQTQPENAQVLGLPVLDWQTLAEQCPNAQWLMGIFNPRCAYSELIAQAEQYGFTAPWMPWELYDLLGETLGWRFWLCQRANLLHHIERLTPLAMLLADDESRDTLLRLCAFRLGLDTDFSAWHSSDAHYFNRLTVPALLGRVVSYVDCGAYHGDTWAALLRQPDVVCGQAVLLEPDPHNYAALVTCVAQHAWPQQCPICLPLAVADHHGILRFSSGNSASCALGAAGNSHVATVALDHLLPTQRVDFIKLNIEGTEALALQGMRQLIARSRPVLAVSIHHHPADLWELPELLQTLCTPHYCFYLRQHGLNGFDTVLYAIPQAKH